MWQFVRWAMRVPAPRLSREEAVAVARDVCEAQGWRRAGWGYPMSGEVAEWLRDYFILTPIGPGVMASIQVENQQGRVMGVKIVTHRGRRYGPDQPPPDGTGCPVPVSPRPPVRAYSNAVPMPRTPEG
jgi:hypothetical protein